MTDQLADPQITFYQQQIYYLQQHVNTLQQQIQHQDVVEQFPIYAKFAGHFIGKGGKGFEHNKRVSGVTRLSCDENEFTLFGTQWKTITIQGERRAVEKSKKLLVLHLDNIFKMQDFEFTQSPAAAQPSQ
tara:strand:- start:95 stop:484 length:390 start_codon:yes stop_codon:yes gene_type:complete